MAKERFISTSKYTSGRLWQFNVALLFSLFTFIFILPAIPEKGQLLTRIILILIVVSGLYAAEFNRKTFKRLRLLGGIVIASSILNIFLIQSKNISGISFVLNTLFFIMVTVALVTQVARAEKVEASTVLCAVNSYLLIGITCTLIIFILELFAPNSFTHNALIEEDFSVYIYFAFVTLTTLGYGDISPLTPLARSLSTFTALFGQLYLVIIMALIIGKYLNAKGTGQKIN